MNYLVTPDDPRETPRIRHTPFFWEPVNAQEAFFSHLHQLGTELIKSGMDPAVVISVRFTNLDTIGDLPLARYSVKAGGAQVAEEAHGDREASLAMLGFARGLRAARSTCSQGSQASQDNGTA